MAQSKPYYYIVEEKEGLELVAWTYQDKSHYGIRDTAKEMLQVFKPTPQMKGNALRAQAIKAFRETELGEYFGRLPRVAMCAAEIKEGQVMVWEGGMGRVWFGLVTKIGKSLLWGTKHDGGEMMFMIDQLDDKLVRGEVQVIAKENVPQKYNTFSKSES